MADAAPPRAYLIGLSTVRPLLGAYHQGQLCLNDCGAIAANEWVRLAHNRPELTVDQWVITPDSLRSIVLLQGSTADDELTGTRMGQKPWLLSSFIANFKAAAAKRINLRLNQPGQPVWQRSYDERLITHCEELAQLQAQLSTATH